MKRNITIILVALTLLFALSATPVYACDADDPPPPCSVCDGNLSDI